MVDVRCRECKKLIRTQKCVKLNGKYYHIGCGYKKYKKGKKK